MPPPDDELVAEAGAADPQPLPGGDLPAWVPITVVLVFLLVANFVWVPFLL